MTKAYSKPAYDLRPYLRDSHSSAQLLPWYNSDDEDNAELPVATQVVKDIWQAFCIPAITATAHDANDLVVVISLVFAVRFLCVCTSYGAGFTRAAARVAMSRAFCAGVQEVENGCDCYDA